MEWGLAFLMFPLGFICGVTFIAMLMVRIGWASRHRRRP